MPTLEVLRQDDHVASLIIGGLATYGLTHVAAAGIVDDDMVLARVLLVTDPALVDVAITFPDPRTVAIVSTFHPWHGVRAGLTHETRATMVPGATRDAGRLYLPSLNDLEVRSGDRKVLGFDDFASQVLARARG